MRLGLEQGLHLILQRQLHLLETDLFELFVVGEVAPRPQVLESLVVFAVLMEGTEVSTELRSELVRHVRSVMGSIVTPEAVYFVSSLPKTRSGKIMRRILRAVASNQAPGDVTTLENEASVQEATAAYERLKSEL